MPLHLTKVAFGASSVEQLAKRLAARADAGAVVLTTRYLPKRHAEIVGDDAGSLYWIIKHALVARSPVLGFGDAPDGRVAIHLEPRAILVAGRHKRAHQGWRYLEAADAPPDLLDGDDGGDVLPPRLLGKLSALALI